ncbi:hypothetical protein AAG570_007671 [Ranatra chinensis]|uniref:F5/8 type C domain-containing protein n=1 Tax=Ranatra chinensis TaxID=642074 RepID=A0ABD0XU72_9HEMI
MFDGQYDTCWSSDAGSPQWIKIKFKERRVMKAFSIQFQGGFAGKDCVLHFGNSNEEFENFLFYPNDVNDTQEFVLPGNFDVTHVEFMFKTSTDFFGRIVIYNLKIY